VRHFDMFIFQKKRKKLYGVYSNLSWRYSLQPLHS